MILDQVTIPFYGGPYDAASPDDPAGTVDVDLDEHGQPPAVYELRAAGPIDMRQNPGTGPILRTVIHKHELVTRLDEDGVSWVYAYIGSETPD